MSLLCPLTWLFFVVVGVALWLDGVGRGVYLGSSNHVRPPSLRLLNGGVPRSCLSGGAA